MKSFVVRTNAMQVYRFLSTIMAREPRASGAPAPKVLDCGAGGPVPPLALFGQQGFEAWGIDRSQHELDLARGFGQEHGIELWMEVHGRGSSDPRNMKTIIDAADHPNCLVCWNCNGGDIDENGSIRWGLEPLKDKVASCHLHDLIDEKYPWLELFSILRDAGYGDRFTLTEMAASPEPVRLMKYYRLLWQELVSKQA